MNNTFIYKGVTFKICPYTARNNPFERGLKYRLGFYAENINGERTLYLTSRCFETKHACKQYAIDNYYIWL